MYSPSKFVAWALRVLAGCAVLFAMLWCMAYYQQTKEGKVFDLTAPPHIEDVHGNVVTQLKAGEGVVFVIPSHRYPKKCWAEYIDLLQGPVTYQFSQTRSQIFSDTDVMHTFHKYHDLPDHLPAGKYELSLLVFPTCDGFDIQPYRIDSGSFLEIVE